MHMRTSFNSIDHPQWFQHLNVNVIFMLNYIKLNYVENYFHIYIYIYKHPGHLFQNHSWKGALYRRGGHSNIDRKDNDRKDCYAKW